jgi:predicted nucleotidyltransferase
MQKYKTRNELRNLVINSFSKEVEIISIFFFGKEVDDKSDEYSDIDMIVCSNDLAKTQSKYLKIFNDISPIIGSYFLNSTENNFSQMVMLKDFSPYQKIDFSITDNIETKISAGFGPFISIYKDDSLTTKVNSKLEIIEKNNVKNQLDDFLFSVPRFTKCLFRKDCDMYRRWKRISDITLVLLYEKYFDWEEKTSKEELSVKELSELNKIMSNGENELLHKIFPPSGIVNIAESYKMCIELLITLCKQKSAYFKVELSEDFILYIEGFLNSEIMRYIEN